MTTSSGPPTADPILQKLDNFHLMDAILDLSDPDFPKEPEWPEAEFIVGNPPFLGGKVMRSGGKSKTRERVGLGDTYVDNMFKVWSDRVRPEAGQSPVECASKFRQGCITA